MASLPSSAVLGRSFDRFDEILYLVEKYTRPHPRAASASRAREPDSNASDYYSAFGLAFQAATRLTPRSLGAAPSGVLRAARRGLPRCGPARTVSLRVLLRLRTGRHFQRRRSPQCCSPLCGRSVGSTRSCISSKRHPPSSFRTPSVATAPCRKRCAKNKTQLPWFL
jgi:hypothetical protein